MFDDVQSVGASRPLSSSRFGGSRFGESSTLPVGMASYSRPPTSLFGATNRSFTNTATTAGRDGRTDNDGVTLIDTMPDFDEVEAPTVALSSSFSRAALADSFVRSGRAPRGSSESRRHHHDANDAVSALEQSYVDPLAGQGGGTRRRASSVSPADVFGVPRSLDSQQRERERMTGPATVLNEMDFVVFGGDDDDDHDSRAGGPSSQRGYVRGTTCKLVLKPGEDVAALENAIARNTLAPPPELGRSLTKYRVMPDPSLVPAPRTERVHAGENGAPLPPFLKPSFLEVDINEQLVGDDDDPFSMVALPRRRHHVGGEGGGDGGTSFDPHGQREPKYVPYAVRPLGHDDVQWKPPKTREEIDAAERRRALLSITEATAAERPPPPPMATRDIAGEYRARQRLVAYDESEAFGFRARQLHDNGALAQLREDMRDLKSQSLLSVDATIVTIRHQTSCYLFSANRRKFLKFDPTDSTRNIGGAGMWEAVELQDGSLYIGVSAYPPDDATIVPMPNLPYMVAVTHTMMHILSLEDATWFVCCLRGLEETRGVGWVHLIDEQTMYVRSKDKQLHGLVPLRTVLEELTILRRSPHDVNPDQPSFFLENHLKYADCRMLRRKPCADSLVAIEGVPGVAIHPKLKEEHMWVFVYNTTASTFLPWRRINNGTLFFVVMENHIVQDATTVLFFAEQLHRMDIGSVVGEKVAVGGVSSIKRGGAAGGYNATQTQRILRVAQRLVIRHPTQDHVAVSVEGDSPRSRHHQAARGEAARGSYDASSATTRLFATGKSVVLRWKRRGASLPLQATAPTNGGQALDPSEVHPQTKPLEERMLLTDLVTGESSLEHTDHSTTTADLDRGVAAAGTLRRPLPTAVSQRVVDLVIKARRHEVHTIIPMHERCAAVLSFDCTTYVVVELDRVARIRAMGVDWADEPFSQS